MASPDAMAIAAALGMERLEPRQADVWAAEGTTAVLEALASIESPFLIGPLPSAPGSTPNGNGHRVRALVPMEGGGRPHLAIREAMSRMVEHAADVTVVHVFTAENRPSFWSPGHHEEAWKKEFLVRYCGGILARFHVTSGTTPTEIAGIATEEDSDVIVLEWNRSTDEGRSPTFRALLATSPIPLVVVPSSWTPHP